MRLARVLAFAIIPAFAAAGATCDGLAKLALSGATIKVAELVPAGSFKPIDAPVVQTTAAFCRVAGVITPSTDSDVQFEVWMPSAGWNGKFQGIGNGGFAGAIMYGGLASAVSHGYATAATDTGHHAGGIDASWALGHPEKIVDFGYRAIHETADKAKTILTAFYGAAPKRSYFSSCSNGGRQALMEAQRFPADYDGIIAGAPAYDWTHLLSLAIYNTQATLADPASYIPASKIPAIEAASLEACDALDGVKDGVIDNPPQCHFDPANMICKGAESDACLTAPQATALSKIYGGLRTAKGEAVFPGYPPGGASGPAGWPLWITGSAPEKSLMFAFGTQFYKNMVFDDAAWDYHSFRMDRDMKVAEDKTAQRMNATNADLSAFKKRGGKLILFHGWSDAAIPATSTVRYYQNVESKMNAKNTEAFVRLFMVPGMQHCAGGPGPNNFNQGGVAQGDAQHDLARALEQWVEGGAAPEQIIATKYKSDVNPASGVVRTRPLCAYPRVARWTGSGSTDDAANFTCVEAGAAGSR